MVNTSHEYLGIAGSPKFIKLAKSLVFGAELSVEIEDHVASIQTVSGTGANHMAALFLAKNLRPKHVLIPSPTWVNHRAIWDAVHVPILEYPYYSPETKKVDIKGMLSALEDTAETGDVVVLQACAHNPTGADLSQTEWKQVADMVKRKKLFTVFDSAYQGFATGNVDRDAWPIQYFVEHIILDKDSKSRSNNHGLCVAQSFSKNFGLYGERVGALHLVTPLHLSSHAVQSEFLCMARAEYSNPPRYGVSIVEEVLGNERLRAQWERDLLTMSSRIRVMRHAFRHKLEENGAPGDWSHIESEIGMFSYTGLRRGQVSRLQREFHIYLLPSGRVSICGLTTKNVDYVAKAIGEVLKSESA